MKETNTNEEEKKTVISGAEITLDDETEEVAETPEERPVERKVIEPQTEEEKIANRLQALELELQRLEIAIDRDQADFDEHEMTETSEYIDALLDRLAENKKTFNTLAKEYRALQHEKTRAHKGASFFEQVPLWEYIYTILMAIAGLPWILTMMSYYFFSAVGSSITAYAIQVIILFVVPLIWALPSIILFFTIKKPTSRKFFRWASIIFAVEFVISAIIMIKAMS